MAGNLATCARRLGGQHGRGLLLHRTSFGGGLGQEVVVHLPPRRPDMGPHDLLGHRLSWISAATKAPLGFALQSGPNSVVRSEKPKRFHSTFGSE